MTLEAVIQTGGKQYLVAPGNKITIEKVAGKPGDDITFDKVLLVTGDKLVSGNPFINGAKVLAKILGEEKEKKVIVYKYKRRHGYHKKQGHRQKLIRVEIKEVCT